MKNSPRTVFMGTGDVGLPSFRWLLDESGCEVVAAITQPDKPVGRHQELQAPAIKTLALERGVPVLQPLKMRAPEAVSAVQALEAELIVVMAYGQILPKAVLDAASVACLNLHASLLPRWRGAAPIQASILAGDSETGITVMYMDVGLDTGDILLMDKLKIRRRETGGVLHDRLAELAPRSLAAAVSQLRNGHAPRVPQGEPANYAAKLSRESGIIDFAAGHCAVDRLIRAMNPWPAAMTFLPTPTGTKRLKVFSCIQCRKTKGAAGEVLQSSPKGLFIGTGDGAVLITDLQLEGKRRLRAAEFLNGYAIAPGTKLLTSL